jgi:hypothetical protein
LSIWDEPEEELDSPAPSAPANSRSEGRKTLNNEEGRAVESSLGCSQVDEKTVISVHGKAGEPLKIHPIPIVESITESDMVLIKCQGFLEGLLTMSYFKNRANKILALLDEIKGVIK